jgi:hypothetical protein
VTVLESLHQGLARLGEPTLLGWMLLGVGLIWLQSRAGLPRSRRDLQWRGAGLALFMLAAVLDLGRGLEAAWPWPPVTALWCALGVPWVAGWLWRRGRWGLAVILGLSVPFWLLITVTAFFGMWLDLHLVGGVLLALALVASGVGAALTWRTPRPVDSPFGMFGRAGGFPFGPGGFRGTGPGRPGSASHDDIVDVEARTVDEAPLPALSKRDD